MALQIKGLSELRERLERLWVEDVMARALRDRVGAEADGPQGYQDNTGGAHYAGTIQRERVPITIRRGRMGWSTLRT